MTPKQKAIKRRILQREIIMSKKQVKHFDSLAKNYWDLSKRYSELTKAENELLEQKIDIFNKS